MQTNLSLLSKALICLAMCSSSALSYALPSDQNQPIDVTADTATINDTTGVTTLTGKVKIIQGSMLITADKLTVHRNKNGDISTMVATGKPAHFTQQQKANEPHSKAWGQKMVYLVSDQTVTITGNAKVQQLSDKFSGEKIVYYMDKAIVKASGTKQRVRMIIQPKGNK
ncbi:MAG: lipopolysaccharide transport periplasmic protein LptA [Oceanospirillaceae bacterium]|nr:lipopolysaccharide transport periplasmic protein LptA [Oceanospirillaceae bacterium]